MSWSSKVPTEADLVRRAKYDAPPHRHTRAAFKVEVEAGRASCWRCGKPIPPGSRWHLGHDDENPAIMRGAEHATCNISAAARKSAARLNGEPPPFVRPVR